MVSDATSSIGLPVGEVIAAAGASISKGKGANDI